MENASHAFLAAVRKSMRQIRSAIGAMTITPALLSAAQRLQYEGYLRREEANAAVSALALEGVAIKEIGCRIGHSRALVHRMFRLRESSRESYLPWLDAEWSAGYRNGAELWRRLRTQGFRGSLRLVTQWATRRRRADQINADTLSRIPSARTIIRLMTVS